MKTKFAGGVQRSGEHRPDYIGAHLVEIWVRTGRPENLAPIESDVENPCVVEVNLEARFGSKEPNLDAFRNDILAEEFLRLGTAEVRAAKKNPRGLLPDVWGEIGEIYFRAQTRTKD
jgi:hypothetical protein